MVVEDAKPTDQFTGWFIPDEIVKLLDEKKIDAEEMILLAMVNGLVSKDRGCFASNEYLADRLNVSTRKISDSISKFSKAKLVIQVFFDGRKRYLETKWRKIDESSVTDADLLKKVKEIRCLADSARQDSRICQAVAQNLLPEYLKSSKEENGQISSSSNGFHLPDEETPRPKIYSQIAAELLLHHLLEKGLAARNTSVSSWTQTILNFLIDSGFGKERFEKVLKWYVKHIRGSKYVPDARSAQGFCEKFLAIEYQMENWSEEGQIEEESKPTVVGTWTAEQASEYLERIENEGSKI